MCGKGNAGIAACRSMVAQPDAPGAHPLSAAMQGAAARQLQQADASAPAAAPGPEAPPAASSPASAPSPSPAPGPGPELAIAEGQQPEQQPEQQQSPQPAGSGGSLSQPQQPSSNGGLPWALLFSDEFKGDSLDQNKWGYLIGQGYEYGLPGFSNGEVVSGCCHFACTWSRSCWWAGVRNLWASTGVFATAGGELAGRRTCAVVSSMQRHMAARQVHVDQPWCSPAGPERSAGAAQPAVRKPSVAVKWRPTCLLPRTPTAAAILHQQSGKRASGEQLAHTAGKLAWQAVACGHLCCALPSPHRARPAWPLPSSACAAAEFRA